MGVESEKTQILFLNKGKEIFQGPASDSDFFVLTENKKCLVIEEGDGFKKIEVETTTLDGKPATAIYFIPIPPKRISQRKLS